MGGAPLPWLRAGWPLGLTQQKLSLGQGSERCPQAGGELKPGQDYRVGEVQTSVGYWALCTGPWHRHPPPSVVPSVSQGKDENDISPNLMLLGFWL